MQSWILYDLKWKNTNSMGYTWTLPRFWWEIHLSWWKNPSCPISKKRLQLQSWIFNDIKWKNTNSLGHSWTLPRFRWKIHISRWKNKSGSISKKGIQLQPRILNGSSSICSKMARSVRSMSTAITRIILKLFLEWSRYSSQTISTSRI